MSGRRESLLGVVRGVDVSVEADEPALDLQHDSGIRQAWRLHADELYGFACRALVDHAAADEAVQETFLRAWRAAASYDRTRPLRPWLFAILRNVVIDETRARRRRPVPQADWHLVDSPTAGPPGQEHADYERIDQLLDEWLMQEALRRVREDHRVVLVETYYKGRSYAAVAHDLGIPEGTARTRAFYGLRALRLALEEMGWNR